MSINVDIKETCFVPYTVALRDSVETFQRVLSLYFEIAQIFVFRSAVLTIVFCIPMAMQRFPLGFLSMIRAAVDCHI